MTIEQIKEYLNTEIQRLEQEEDDEWFDERKINNLIGQKEALEKLQQLMQKTS